MYVCARGQLGDFANKENWAGFANKENRVGFANKEKIVHGLLLSKYDFFDILIAQSNVHT